jgi:putative MATE family efflux protein
MADGDAVPAAPGASGPQAGLPGGRRTAPEALLQLPPWRAIVRLAAPTTFVMLIAATSNVLYTYYVSRLGPEAIAAIALVFPVSMLAITAMGGGIGSGAAAAIARALGGGRRSDAEAVAEHALVLSAVIGVLFGALILVGAPTLFRLMGGTGAVLDNATLIARVLFGGAMITFVGSMFDSVLRGEGNVRVAAIWSSMSLVLQIALTPVLMFACHLGLVGAPVAVLLSQFLATIPRARYVLRGHGILHPRALPRHPARAPLRRILRVGIPASLSTMINYLGLAVLTGIVGHLGPADLAAYGLGTRFDFLLLTFVYGFGAAVLTLVGMTTGAGRPDRAVRYVATAGSLIVVLLLVPAAVLWWHPALWIGIFTQDAQIQAVGAHYFRIIGPSYPFVGLSMVLAFAFQGLGRATAPLAWMVVRVAGVLIAATLCTRVFGLGDQAVFTTVAVANVASTVVLYWLFARTRRHIGEHRATTPAAMLG